MKLFYLVIGLTLLSGCATSIHKQRLECVQQINQAERIIERGKDAVDLGQLTIKKGEQQKAKAKEKLQELL